MSSGFSANLSIRGKVLAGYAILLIPFLALAAVTWFMTRAIGEGAAEMREDSLPVLAALESVRTAGLRVIETTNTFALINAIGGDEQDRFASFSLDKKQEMRDARQEFERAFADLEALADSDGGGSNRTKNNVAFARKNILKQSDRIASVVSSGGKPATLLQLRERFETSAINFRNLIQQAVDAEKAELEMHQADLNDDIRDAVFIVFGISAIGLTLAIGGGYILSGRISRPIRILRDATARVGAGDFDAAPTRASNDEVGELVDAFRGMAQRLKDDISARRASEEAARRAEARLTDAIESIDEGFVLYDADERLVACNQRFREIFRGVEDLMVPGARWEEIMRQGVARGQYSQARQDPEQWITERTSRFRHPGEPYEQQLADGRWLRIADRRTSDGGTVGVRTDITSIKKAQTALAGALAELKASEAQFKSLISNLPGAVYRCEWDKDWTDIFVSEAIKDITGYPASDFLYDRARSFASITHPDDRQHVEEYVATAAAKREPFSGEFRVCHRDGSIRWLLDRGQVIFTDDNRPLHLEGVLFDITDQKRSQLALERAHAELRMATEKLAEQERLSTMGRLTATVSHELRNPLAAIRASLATVRELSGATNSVIARSLDRCDRNIARCVDIIDDLLDFTRTRELARDPTALDAWLADVLDQQGAPSGIEVRREFGAGCDTVIDRRRCQQVVVNLMENAVQALNDPSWEPPPGHPREIAVRTELAGPHVRLSIIDTGPGIPPEILPRIFEPLFTTKGFGVGLGLCLVRQVVEQHGGTIDVDSQVGQGTTVVITLPRTATVEARPHLAQTQVDAA